MDIILTEIREWLVCLLTELNNLPEDTIPERIKSNRDRMTCLIAKSDRVKRLVSTYPIGVKTYIENFLQLLYEWQHYFDTGYKAPHTIDELPDLIRTYITNTIKKIDEQS